MILDTALLSIQAQIAKQRIQLSTDITFPWPSLFNPATLITRAEFFEEFDQIRMDGRRDLDPAWFTSSLLTLNPYEKAELTDAFNQIKALPATPYSELTSGPFGQKKKLRLNIADFQEWADCRTDNQIFKGKGWLYRSVWLKAKLREWGISDPKHMIDSCFGDKYIESLSPSNLLLFQDLKVAENPADLNEEKYLGGSPSGLSASQFGDENHNHADVQSFIITLNKKFPGVQRAYYYNSQSLDGLLQSGFSAATAKATLYQKYGSNPDLQNSFITPTDVFNCTNQNSWFFLEN